MRAGTRAVLAAATAVVTVFCGIQTIPASAAANSGPRTVSVVPAGGLTDDQTLTVSWSGFAPIAGVVIRQCGPDPTEASACSTALVAGESSDESGRGTASIPVVITDPVNNRLLEGAPEARCDATHPCSIAVVPQTAPDDLSQAAIAAITFAKSRAACPEPGALTLRGEGSDSLERAMLAWIPQVCDPPLSVSADYVPKNDPSGVEDVACGLRDIAGVQAAPPDDSCPFTGKSRPASAVAPVAVSGLAFAFNMRDTDTGRRIDALKLTPDVLAEIFTGQILSGRDPRITKLNPGVKLPTKLRPIARADRSQLTVQMSTFFWQTAHTAYTSGGPAFSAGPIDVFPTLGGVDARTGGDPVALAVARPPDNNPKSDPTYGYIGVLDTSMAAAYGLPSASILGTDDKTWVPPTADSLARGLAAMKPGPTGTLVANPAPKDPRAYRLPVVSYFLLPPADSPATVTAAGVLFTGWVTTTGQSKDILPLGYLALPPTLVSQAANAYGLRGDSKRAPAAADPSPAPSASASGSAPSAGPATAAPAPAPVQPGVPVPASVGPATAPVVPIAPTALAAGQPTNAPTRRPSASAGVTDPVMAAPDAAVPAVVTTSVFAPAAPEGLPASSWLFLALVFGAVTALLAAPRSRRRGSQS